MFRWVLGFDYKTHVAFVAGEGSVNMEYMLALRCTAEHIKMFVVAYSAWVYVRWASLPLSLSCFLSFLFYYSLLL